MAASENLNPHVEYTCREHQEEMVSSFIEMVDTRAFSDVVVKVEDETFHCHKVILAATCPYFKGMFSSPFAENESNEVFIKGIRAAIFRYLIDYIYTGKILIDTENAQEVITAADMLNLDSLKHVCCAFLQEQIRTSNCLGIWHLSKQLHLVDLEKKAWTYATTCFSRVMDGEEVLDLSLSDICELLSSPKLKVPGEEVICKCALAWLHQKPERKQHLKRVMATIHLDELKPPFIKTTLMTHPLVKTSSFFKKLLQGIMDHLTMNLPCPSAVSFLPLRLNTNTSAGILLLGGKVGQPMNRIHTFSFVSMDAGRAGETNSDCGAAHVHTMGTLPTIHKYSAACCQGNTIYLAGMGSDMKEVWKYDSAYTWTRCKSLKYARTGLTLNAGFTDTLYAVGGAASYIGTGVCQNVSWIEEYNVSDNTWTTVGQLQIPVCYHTAAFYLGKMFIMGGFQRDTLACDKIQMFDTQTHATVKLEMRLPKPMAYGKGLVVQEHVILVDKDYTLVFSGADLLKEVNHNYDPSSTSGDDDEEEEELQQNLPVVTAEPPKLENQEEEARMSDEEESSSSSSPVNTGTSATEFPIITQRGGHSVENVEQEEQPSTSYSQVDEEDTDETADQTALLYPMHTVFNCSSYMVKRGCGVELVAADILGDTLVVFGGRKDERNSEQARVLSRSIQACNLRDALSPGNDLKWRVIGKLDQPTVVFMCAKFKVKKKTT